MSEIIQTEDTVRLYEYELYKPDLEDALAHHGILGMHWGKRNGPPYPLSKAISTGKKLKSSVGAIHKKHKKKAALKKAKKTKRRNEKLKKEQQKIQKTKDEIIKSNDIKAMLKDVGNFSNDEINKVLNRLDTIKKLNDRVKEQERASKSKVSRYVDDLKKTASENIRRGSLNVAGKIANASVEVAAKEGLKYLVTDNPDAVINKQFVENLFKNNNKKKRR